MSPRGRCAQTPRTSKNTTHFLRLHMYQTPSTPHNTTPHHHTKPHHTIPHHTTDTPLQTQTQHKSPKRWQIARGRDSWRGQGVTWRISIVKTLQAGASSREAQGSQPDLGRPNRPGTVLSATSPDSCVCVCVLQRGVGVCDGGAVEYTFLKRGKSNLVRQCDPS